MYMEQEGQRKPQGQQVHESCKAWHAGLPDGGTICKCPLRICDGTQQALARPMHRLPPPNLRSPDPHCSYCLTQPANPSPPAHLPPCLTTPTQDYLARHCLRPGPTKLALHLLHRPHPTAHSPGPVYLRSDQTTYAWVAQLTLTLLAQLSALAFSPNALPCPSFICNGHPIHTCCIQRQPHLEAGDRHVLGFGYSQIPVVSW